jgi:hypothetical protein
MTPTPAQTNQNNSQAAGLGAIGGAAIPESGGGGVATTDEDNGGRATPSRAGTPFNIPPPMGGIQDTSGITPWGRQFLQNTGGRMSFSRGGAIPTDADGDNDGDQFGKMMQDALGVVGQVLTYTRGKYGIKDNGGQKQAMNTEGFRQSDNVDDRTDNPGRPEDAGTPGVAKAGYSMNNADRLMGRYNEWSNRNNPMSKQLGIDDIQKKNQDEPVDYAAGPDMPKRPPPPEDNAQVNASRAADQGQAIPTDEEEAQ